MCPPVSGSREEACPGRHTGRPLRSRSKYPSTPEERAGTESRPYRSIAVPSSGPMYLRHGFRRPNFVPKFGASVIGIGPYEKEGKPPRPPGPAAHSEASATRMGGRGGDRDRDPPQSVQQPRAIPQSPFGRQLPLQKGAFPCGGRGSGRTHRSAPTRSSECTATPGGAGQSPPPTERRGIRRGIGQRSPNAGSRSAGPSLTSSPAKRNALHDRRHRRLPLPSPVPTAPATAYSEAPTLRLLIIPRTP